ncbi:transducin WD-40 repeat-containing protein [Cryptosporidium ubiquitum]|uniref:Pre-mRNA-processing factor 17 n=1 Tax=Cryptosporidium ubiquitum TaxID=857276 RepID=A0A1J4MK90_9CRYT|nr:transducin WD-40 repeat-containing protein [Cryptosporidium ubiquitum]OII74622.1 transducin WD-40 repeat-containing protein [Cryptosporidium ubiquitum]
MVLFERDDSINIGQIIQKSSAPELGEDIINDNGLNEVIPNQQICSFSCSSTAFDLNYNSQNKNYSLKSVDRQNKSNQKQGINFESANMYIGEKKPRLSSRKCRYKYLGPWKDDQKEEFASESAKNQFVEENRINTLESAANDEIQGSDTDDSSKDEEQFLSTFLGKDLTDYQNRSWIISPNEIKERLPNEQCCAPKRLIKVLKAHSMGVQAIRFIPKTGHLLLSAGLDSQIKIWNSDNKCTYIYHGHKNAVRDIQFSSGKRDCKSFYSCGYDKQILFWDAEYGKIRWKNSNGKTPYCVSVHPKNEYSIIVGFSNKKAIQYDTRANEVVQEYNEHQGAVNTVTFCEDGKKFVTTSDDKKMFVWDYGIPIVVKHIADPLMQSMPYVTLHSDGQYLACQSMDNKILVYDTYANYRCTKKRFTGLKNSGYAIQCDISPDGQYLISGDINGKLHFWDWKTTKNFRSINAHEGVSIGCQWHPAFPSRIASCGWDGTIKIWE